MNNLKLLIKFPTRSRPDKFFKVLDLYYHLLESNNYEFVISCDVDDITMNNNEVKNKLSEYENLSVSYKPNNCKVQAINSDLENKKFDILLLASDDMIPEVRGYDVIIKEKFNNVFPDSDGVLWLDDGFQGNNLNTLSIIGYNYYKRFNYIYHPDYKSLYCDTEFTIVSQMLNKVHYFNKCLIRHCQYSIIKDSPDDLYVRNDKLQHEDLQTFNKRRIINFNL
jgi:hypothetical protein